MFPTSSCEFCSVEITLAKLMFRVYTHWLSIGSVFVFVSSFEDSFSKFCLFKHFVNKFTFIDIVAAVSFPTKALVGSKRF